MPPPKVSALDERLRRWLELSLADANELQVALPDGPTEVFLAAGAPWYLTLFGRDSIWAARMLLPIGTELALGTLRALARRQGRSFDTLTGEQPGKILHEVRRQDQLRPDLGKSAHPPTCLLRDYRRHSALGVPSPRRLEVGPAEADVATLLGPLGSCLDWLAGSVLDGDGFVRYIDESGRGLANQGWKDSSGAIQSRDGRLARPPIALCEVQAYAYEAATAGADLLEAFGLDGPERWRQLAAELADRFRSHFWVADEEGPYPAVALQDDGAPVDSLSSNIGHLLGTGLLSPEESALVARRLGGPDLNSGFGLRTLAVLLGYNPFSYHRGSVWPHDTAIAITRTGPHLRGGGAKVREPACRGPTECGRGFRLPATRVVQRLREGGAPTSAAVPGFLPPSGVDSGILHLRPRRPARDQPRRARPRIVLAPLARDGPAAWTGSFRGGSYSG